MNRTDRNEIESIVKSEIKKFLDDSLDKEVKKVVARSNTQTRNELVSLIKDSLESVYKMLWMKRDFWKHDIK
jgi:hypothetical protein